MSGKETLLIIDSNALLHRAFHALPPLSNGTQQTGAIYGFLLALFKAVKDFKPKYIVACFDTPAPTFRHKQFKEYKGKRPKTADELVSQIIMMPEVLKEFGIPVFAKPGFEADDLIATVAVLATKQKKVEAKILTGDMDTLQLINKQVSVCALGHGVKDMIIYDSEKVVERYGISPKQVVDYKSLLGDQSDNVPGVSGIGEKTAADLLQRFGNLENIYKAAEKEDKTIKERTRALLLKDKEQAFLARSLVDLKRDVDVDFDFKKCLFGNFNKRAVEKVLLGLRFTSLVKRLPELREASTKKTQKVLI